MEYEDIHKIDGGVPSIPTGKLTIADIAAELGVSKSTVSRAISGKGRIGSSTVQRVSEYIEKYNYRPNSIAKSLANSKTYNIGVVLPADSNLRDTPFFQNCLLGACEIAAALDYDVVVTTVKESDIRLVKRLVEHNKVDGFIITRNFSNDITAAYLKECKIPFVLIGSSEDTDIVQIDNDHREACEKLTSLLIAGGAKEIALIAGDMNHMVNRERCAGFYSGLQNNGLQIHQDLVYTNCDSLAFVEQAVYSITKRGVDCIVCTDDVICGRVLTKLQEKGYVVSKDIKVASFYDSSHLENNNPPITAISVDVEELGREAGKLLIDLINGQREEHKTMLDYTIHLRRSTN